MSTKTIVILIIALIILLLIIQNLDIIGIDLLFWSIQVSLLLIILFPFLLGIIFGWILGSLYRKKK